MVPWNVFGSQPSGHSVFAAFEAMDSIVARRRGLRNVILIVMLRTLGAEMFLESERMRTGSNFDSRWQNLDAYGIPKTMNIRSS